MSRSYTVAEIDALRGAIDNRNECDHPHLRKYFDPFNYDELKNYTTRLEDRLRTYMLNGTTTEEVSAMPYIPGI